MNRQSTGFAFAWDRFSKDALASFVVFLVALPLCMGVAIASGVPPAMGLITGIVGGLVVGLISGSPLQVSGPAAGLTVLVYEIVHEQGLAALGLIILIAGLLQVVAGLLKLGQWFRAISPSVLHGMLAGIGVLIIASQVHVAVDDKPRGSGIENLLAIPEAIWKGIFPLDGSSHHLAAGIGLLTIAILVAWSRLPKPLKAVPAPLVAVLAATFAAWALKLPIQYVDVPANLFAAMRLPEVGSLGAALTGPILAAAAAVALIASAETLLSASAVDRMHSGPRTKYDKELVAQGIGNAICGFLGALPMTGVIVRSSVNVSSGAQTRMSTVLHGSWLLAFVCLLPFLLSRIPTASLAAMLVYTGFKLVSPAAVRKLAAFGKGEVAIYAVTVTAILMTNLLEGVLVGLGLALVKLLVTFSKLSIRVEERGDTSVMQLEGSATFLRLPKLASALERVPAGRELVVEIGGLDYIDHACLELLRNWEKQHADTGGLVTLHWEGLTAKYHRRAATGPLSLVEKPPLVGV